MRLDELRKRAQDGLGAPVEKTALQQLILLALRAAHPNRLSVTELVQRVANTEATPERRATFQSALDMLGGLGEVYSIWERRSQDNPPDFHTYGLKDTLAGKIVAILDAFPEGLAFEAIQQRLWSDPWFRTLPAPERETTAALGRLVRDGRVVSGMGRFRLR